MMFWHSSCAAQDRNVYIYQDASPLTTKCASGGPLAADRHALEAPKEALACLPTSLLVHGRYQCIASANRKERALFLTCNIKLHTQVRCTVVCAVHTGAYCQGLQGPAHSRSSLRCWPRRLPASRRHLGV